MTRRADNLKIAQEQGRHVPNGFPHYSSKTGLCLCIDPCCQGKNGCRCKFCPCQITEKDHSELVSISANTISLTILDGVTNG